MKKITYFHMFDCPYCIQADEVIGELLEEHPEWAAVEFEKIDERVHPEIADRYDSYANPSMFLGEEKLYEARLFETKEECRHHLEKVFLRAMEA